MSNSTYNYANVTIANGGSATSISLDSIGYPNWSTTATAWQSDVAQLNYNNGSGTLDLKGPNADINVNGRSLSKAITAIEEALLIPGRLNRNLALEQEYAELRECADRYQELERKFLEQKKVWNILKTQDQ